MRVVFMGTPDFSVGALEAIIQAGHEVTAVVTQPDKPKGRGKEMQYTPVKECALKYGVTVFQPIKIKTAEAVERLREFPADIFVVAAFGQILSKEILEMPRYGCVNIHASLLPKYRGAAPIQWAVINGEAESGITIMQMDEGLDTGDMLLKSVVPIAQKETGESLHDKLSVAGANLMVEALEKIEANTVVAKKQKEEETCYAKMLVKILGEINWKQDAVGIERLVRGLNSWPSAYTYLNGKTLKIWESEVAERKDLACEVGSIIEIGKDSITVACGKQALNIYSLQLEGKKRMLVKDFLLGNAMKIGDKLGGERKQEEKRC